MLLNVAYYAIDCPHYSLLFHVTLAIKIKINNNINNNNDDNSFHQTLQQ